MRPTTSTMARHAWWGPLACEVSDERTTVRAGEGPLVEIRCPLWQDRGMTAIFDALREGLPVLVDGEPRVTLRQPERRGLRRRGRRILVEGDPAIVPPGLFLRARWQKGMGLEAAVELGAPQDQRLIRPPIDLGLGLPWYRTRVDRSVTPTLVAVWGAAHQRLLEATQVL